MKTAIHPQWFPETQVACACGNTFTVGSTTPKIHVEVCYNCHPFYTGESRFVDTKGRVDRFRELQAKGIVQSSKKDRRRQKRFLKLQEEFERPESLDELRKEK